MLRLRHGAGGGRRAPSLPPSAGQELRIQSLLQGVAAGPRKAANWQPGLGARSFAGIGVRGREHLGRVGTEARALLEVVAQTLPVLDARATPAAGALFGLELMLEEMGQQNDEVNS